MHQWFRVYIDILYNRKLARVSDSAFRLFFEMIALYKAGQIPTSGISVEDLAQTLRRDRRKVSRTFDELLSNFLITSNGLPSKYSERQFLQAESTQRVTKHRANKKALQKQPSESESESETESDTETYKNKIPTTRKAEFPAESHKLAKLLAQLMVDNDPKAKLPTTEKAKDAWLKAIDMIHRIDGRQWDEIGDVIRWCQADDFWQSNILSPAKLRKQFPKLRLAMRRPVEESVEDYNRRVLKQLLKDDDNEEV